MWNINTYYILFFYTHIKLKKILESNNPTEKYFASKT